MMYKALFFDLNGTLVDILTDESKKDLFRAMANLLGTYGVTLSADTFREQFFAIVNEQRLKSKEEHAEFDVIGVFKVIIEKYGTDVTKAIPKAKYDLLPEFLADAFRAFSMFKLKTYPHVTEILKELKKLYRIAAVSDAQRIWAVAEMNRVGLGGLFEEVVISSDLGVRKPTPVLFKTALEAMKLEPSEVIFVGNDTLRDVYGGHKMGMKTIFFKSNQGDHADYGVKPDYTIFKFEEVLKAINKLEAKAEPKPAARSIYELE